MLLPELHRHFAAAALRVADYGPAAYHARQALGLARELAVRMAEATSLHMLGEIALACDDAAGAAPYLTQALPILEDADQKYEPARCRLTVARLYLATGNHAAAQALWAAAVAAFRKLAALRSLVDTPAIPKV